MFVYLCILDLLVNNFQKEDGEPGDTTKEEIIDGEKGKITSAPDKPEEEIPDNITPEPLNIPKVSEISKGITLYLGLYEQDNVVENGLEPIEWQVLDVKDGKELLLSKYILEPLAYGDSLFLGGAPYASSIVRAWLYESFYNISFSSEEKEIMKSKIQQKLQTLLKLPSRKLKKRQKKNHKKAVSLPG